MPKRDRQENQQGEPDGFPAVHPLAARLYGDTTPPDASGCKQAPQLPSERRADRPEVDLAATNPEIFECALSPFHAEIATSSIVHSAVGLFEAASLSIEYAFDPTALPEGLSRLGTEILVSTMEVHEPSHVFDIYNTLFGEDAFMRGPWGWIRICELCDLLARLGREGVKLNLPLAEEDEKRIAEWERVRRDRQAVMTFLNGFVVPSARAREQMLRRAAADDGGPSAPWVHGRKAWLESASSGPRFVRALLRWMDSAAEPEAGPTGRALPGSRKRVPLLDLGPGMEVFPGICVITEANALLRQMQAVSTSTADHIASYVASKCTANWGRGWPHVAALAVLDRMRRCGMEPQQMLAVLDLCMGHVPSSGVEVGVR